jgi:hypothetical protein
LVGGLTVLSFCFVLLFSFSLKAGKKTGETFGVNLPLGLSGAGKNIGGIK